MPWYLRILDIGFYVVQFIILLVVINVIQPVGFTGALGFSILYLLYLWLTLGVFVVLLPTRHQKYFLNRSPDNPEGCRDMFTYFADVYNSLRNKLKELL